MAISAALPLDVARPAACSRL